MHQLIREESVSSRLSRETKMHTQTQISGTGPALHAALNQKPSLSFDVRMHDHHFSRSYVTEFSVAEFSDALVIAVLKRRKTKFSLISSLHCNTKCRKATLQREHFTPSPLEDGFTTSQVECCEDISTMKMKAVLYENMHILEPFFFNVYLKVCLQPTGISMTGLQLHSAITPFNRWHVFPKLSQPSVAPALKRNIS